MAYAVRKGDKWCVVLDDQAGPECENLVVGTDGLLFRPDGTLEYVAAKAGNLFRVKHVSAEE